MKTSNIIFDDLKGFCYDNSSNEDTLRLNQKEVIVTSGFDLLPWEKYFQDTDEHEAEYDHQQDEEQTISDKKKLTKHEKREQRLQKKINASRNKKLKRQQEILESNGEVAINVEDNPFVVQQDIKNTHSKIIKQASDTTGRDFKILQYHSIALYKSDLDHILIEEWICDNNISLVFELINQLFLKKSENKFSYQVQLLYPSLVQLFLHIPIGAEFESLLPVKELQKLKFIFIPVNYIDDYQQVDLEQANNGDHWVICLLNQINNKLYVYNSMNEELEDHELLKELVKRLRLCKSIIKNNASIEIIQMKCDQQSNFNDCGVYLLMITCYLIKTLLYDKTINLDISDIKFNSIRGRLYILELIYKLTKQV